MWGDNLIGLKSLPYQNKHKVFFSFSLLHKKIQFVFYFLHLYSVSNKPLPLFPQCEEFDELALTSSAVVFAQ